MEETQDTVVKPAKAQVELTVTEDKIAVLLSCNCEFAVEPDVLEKIQVQLNRKGVKAELDVKQLSVALSKAGETGEEMVDLVIARGRQPVPPKDGWLEWSRDDYFADGWYIDPETKRIDFRQKIAAPTVEEGELLVKVHLPRPGKDGCNVYGAPIRVPQPKRPEIRGGPNVYWDEKEHGYRAKCPGRVKLRGMTLDVENAYRISGDVGGNTGNIKHNGQVVVDGDVESEFKVEATGSLEVRGVIGACDIVCGGNLTSKGGINGGAEKKINVTGDVYAKYIDGAVIKSEGNIFADREIFQSTICAAGEINSAAKIVGGGVMAGKGITAGQTGSKGYTKTTLIAGLDYRLQESIKANASEIDELKGMLKRLEIGCKNLQAGQSHLLDHKLREKLTEIEFKMMEIQEEIGRLETENNEIRATIFASRGAQIKILNMAYPGTVLRILDAQRELEEPLIGPIVASYDIATKGIKLSSDVEEETE